VGAILYALPGFRLTEKLLGAMAVQGDQVLRLLVVFIVITGSLQAGAQSTWVEPNVVGASENAVTLGRDLDGDGDTDEVDIRLEVIEIEEEVYPGQFVTFWVFAPEGEGMISPARAPSPTIRVEVGDRVRITLHNTHYFPHTIHLHGTIHPNAMDGVPDITQPAVAPGEAFTYDFVAKNPGTHFYHCHVQPDVHVLMGLVGMLIIEPNRPQNNFSHLVPGAGRIHDLSRAAMEHYDLEYSLVYMDIDDRLNRIPAIYRDPREIEKRMHREYDSTRRVPNIFLLNGRSFPFTLRDTPVRVKSGERVKLRILNAGARTMHLHTHGHHPTQTHLDGYAVPEAMRLTRDVFTIGAAQRIDLELKPGDDNYFASGPGTWIMHDHTEQATTNKGINPGGDITAIVYEEFWDEGTGLPRVATGLDRFFDPEYYRGKVPVFDPAIFHTTREDYDYGWAEVDVAEGEPAYPVRETSEGDRHSEDILETHKPVATSCKEPRGFRRVVMKGGTEFAGEGEVYAFEPAQIHVERCEEVEIVLENTDSVRHAMMLPGLNPMFMLEFAGPATRSARFIAPDQDITLEFHCHVETHEKMGMHGWLIVGAGGRAAVKEMATPVSRRYEGVGVVVAVQPRKGRIVVDHQEIPGFMAPMVMGFLVSPASLIKDLKPHDKIRFIIDADQRAIVEIVRLEN